MEDEEFIKKFINVYKEGARFVVFDVEMLNGKGSGNQWVIEIGAVEAGLNHSKGALEFQKILKYDTDDWGQYRVSFSIHRIRKAEILKGEDRIETIKAFMNFIKGSYLITHTKIDITAIRREIARHDELAEYYDDLIWENYFDSCKLARILLPELKGKENGGHGVSNLSKFFKIKNPHAHRALADSVTTKKIVGQLLKKAINQYSSIL